MLLHKKSILWIAVAALMIWSCDLNNVPFDGQEEDVALESIEGVQAVTYGNYHRFVGEGYFSYMRDLHKMAEYPADNVALSGITTDPLFNTYNYNHTANQGDADRLWGWAYEIIYGTNRVIEEVETGESADADQLVGENLFMRALAHFHLVTNFARPYTQSPESNPGIPIKTNSDPDELPGRSTVAEVYDFIVDDLLQSADLMSMDKPNSYASTEVVYGLLSRIYLYMEENELAIEYANRVIDSGRYSLFGTSDLPNYYRLPNESNPETIFAIRHTQDDDHGFGNIGSMYFRSDDGVGWGEMFASESFRDLLKDNPDDRRIEFLQPRYVLDDDGIPEVDDSGEKIVDTRNGYPIWYILKYSFQDDIVSLSSPVILRLAEIYLNRAEANAKLGNDSEALEDVNLIRERAGLTGDALYSEGDLHGHISVLDVVLEERRLELAFEGHRKFDLFRNDRAMVRDYPGTHLNPNNPGVDMDEGTQIIEPDAPRVVFLIPENELALNPNLVQNP
ncbi:MAG: RagB/SusD family nutrient uptake outer membrane protein [Balneolaceae bacterium]|nr:RagB/SusD family nutrient uptake outer membrane protein [Balneolaceae bacterium]MCH8548436.1 RagB/SusD family nutrient uptake outer membrane protein [Balneolaceae bacterium]